MNECVAPVASTASLTVLKTGWPVSIVGAAFAGRHAADDVRAVRDHAAGVERPSRPVMPWTITLLFLSRKIDIVSSLPSRARRPWPRLRPSFRPATCRRRRRSPAFFFVGPGQADRPAEPCAGRRPSASTMPRATWSPRVMPPKMLMKSTLTRGSLTTSS